MRLSWTIRRYGAALAFIGEKSRWKVNWKPCLNFVSTPNIGKNFARNSLINFIIWDCKMYHEITKSRPINGLETVLHRGTDRHTEHLHTIRLCTRSSAWKKRYPKVLIHFLQWGGQGVDMQKISKLLRNNEFLCTGWSPRWIECNLLMREP